MSPRQPIRVAAVQPHLELGAVESNLLRIEDLIRDAHREHDPQVIVVPEAMTSPNVFHDKLRGVARPVDGAPFQLLTRLSRELDCVIGGGFLARRGDDAYGTFVLAEPDGSAHLHDKDIPTAWENNYYRGGDDEGRFHCATLGLDVGLCSGWEWMRYRTSRRLRGVDLVLGGMCWPSFPLNWPGPLRRWVDREHAVWRQGSRELPRQVARLVGAPVVHAAHVGPVESQTPLAPSIPWKTEMIGETQICDADGTIRARLTLEDGEGHIGAEITPGSVAPLDPLSDRFWIPLVTPSTYAAWYAMNAHGRIVYRWRKARGLHEWQSWPAGDLPDELGPVADDQAQHFATTA
ncbi:amidohydrolase-like protein [Patulibacter medicamentivorans]|uniref:Amidohydrolase-like protein n=1 Tax=Patulibacter medicamentivorans TaxID=1097667 RepID=H0E3W6_9ACTN|nr:carbon-nitrogen hydrolase family protein [Patulibacter medicamentivorans]EHN11614.1 amidohydrolase-like protein [Patulibacter medicamentivorans]